MKIINIKARYILDSRGWPTVEADVFVEGNVVGRASVPSGASTGSKEAVELRDNDTSHYLGKGVSKAVANIEKIILPAITGLDAEKQQLIDIKMRELDGSDNKANLGANAILAVSLAVAKACANHKKIPFYEHIGNLASNSQYSLPMPMINIFNGGKHAQDSTDIQEFMIIPVGAQSLPDAIEMSVVVFHNLKTLLEKRNLSTLVGDEGGFAPQVVSGSDALDLISQSILDSGLKLKTDMAIGIDVAASELYENNIYNFKREAVTRRSDELINYYAKLINDYPIISIEDGLDENSWKEWQELSTMLGNKLQIIGDDLLVTNTKLLNKAIKLKAANAILIKPNQIGTLSETIEAVQTAKKAGWRTIISHRSGETEDTSIAHIAVGLDAGQIKTGSLSRTERTSKYNELIRISQSNPNLKLSAFK